MPESPSELTLKITLRHVRPPVWRRVAVADDMTLAQLHRVVQAAMGWTDSHLHEFEVGGRRYGVPDPDETFGMAVANEARVSLRQALGRGKKLRYTYDFGDGWEHEIAVEARGPADPEKRYPLLLAGRRACPPEDVGGPWGYADFLQALADPKHEMHAEMSEWIGGGFDPDAFDREAAEADLARLARRRRTRRG